MGNIRLFGVSTDRLIQLRKVAKQYSYAYDFGETFEAMAEGPLFNTVQECISNQRFDFLRALNVIKKIIFIGAPGVGYDSIAVTLSASSGIPLVDWDFFMEKPIVELIEAGVIKSKDEFRSESSVGKVGTGTFDYSYKSMQRTAWILWAEAVAMGNIPHCNAGKIMKYPEIISALKERGFRFVKISVPLDKYIHVLNKYDYIKHYSNWKAAEKKGQISQFAEKRWEESEDLFNQNKDLIDLEISYNDDPIEMIKDVVVPGF